MRFNAPFAALLSAIVCTALNAAAASTGPPWARSQLGSANQVPYITNCSASSEEPVYTITLDDGIKNDDYHSTVVNKFHNRGVKPMFFVNGDNWNCILGFADTIKQNIKGKKAWYGSHGWAHPNATSITMEEWKRDVRLLELAFVKMGRRVPLFYRFPYGEHTDAHLKWLKKRGYVAALGWSIDSLDTSGLDKPALLKELREELSSPDLSKNLMWLNHEVKDITVKEGLLNFEFKQMDKLGKKLVNFRQCLDYHGPMSREPTSQELKLVEHWSSTDCKAFAAAYDASRK